MLRGRPDDIREITRLQARIDAIKAGKGKSVDAPIARAAARALNFALGKAAGKAISYGLRNRSKKIFRQTEPFVEQGSRVLDLGCGDGEVGQLFAEKGCQVTLMDIVDYNKTRLPFFRYNGRDTRLADEAFDHVLLLTVLHHSDDPIRVMEEALRVTRGNVIIIESVYFNRLHEQVNRFFDWFYNRALNNPDINVPFNFLHPDAWPLLFQRLGGKLRHMEHLGIDEPMVPEWHTLYVVEK